jgi:hypothetical protein
VSIEIGQLKRPMPGIMCQKRSGRPRSTTTNRAHHERRDGEQLADDHDVVHVVVSVEVGGITIITPPAARPTRT